MVTNLAAAALLMVAIAAPAAAHILDNGRIHVVFADPSSGYTAADNDRVDSIAWITGGGTSTGNLVAAGGPLHCNDPQEFFGESYGDGANARPYLVIAGATSSWKSKAGNTLTGKTKVNLKKLCDATPDGETSSTYTLSKAASRVNQMTVQRSFTFTAASTAGDLRVYVPRLPIGTFASLLWPNAEGVVQTGNANSCELNCVVTDWNGTWFAEQNSAGQGLMVIRSPSGTPPAVLVFDNDSFSNSNNSSIALSLPNGGFLGTYKETENICFFDATTWPASRQSAGKLPIGCTTP